MTESPSASTGDVKESYAKEQVEVLKAQFAEEIAQNSQDKEDEENPRPKVAVPSAAELRAELTRTTQRTRFRVALRNTFFVVMAVAAAAILAAMLFIPTLRIYGSSMAPTLTEGNIVVAFKGSTFKTGDVIAFYYNNKVLVKRVIAGPGSWVDISEDGVVSVDGQVLDEPYVSELSRAECNISFPYQVPDGRYFVLGDNRPASADSRLSTLGSVSEEQIIGQVFARIWPLNEIKLIG